MQKALEDEINPTFESIKRFHKQQDDLFRKFTQFQHDLIGLCEKQIADCDKVCDRRSYDYSYLSLNKAENSTGEPSVKMEKDLAYDSQLKKINYVLGNSAANASLQFLVKTYLPEIEEVRFNPSDSSGSRRAST
ncbi:hypothetical protein DI09_7p370 [Mitosporidium daphniae]|uniref:Uncharacterized protein n=1 Tax=Mitosporidium daphniae TaxID=1485682 RepID=A0A098VMH7_9MICR|nr:uncharacterized protein DI09_7p370 [Mitosporidium daphniae]KGG50258.1 hypothetical protein DI09_7p370 [Mitosporidium daphniae]|eukprot:XP_013236685.1 uncharacterized protein DI09_7p370 [Mitosporidium daphniae]